MTTDVQRVFVADLVSTLLFPATVAQDAILRYAVQISNFHPSNTGQTSGGFGSVVQCDGQCGHRAKARAVHQENAPSQCLRPIASTQQMRD